MWWPFKLPMDGEPLDCDILERNLRDLYDVITGGLTEHVWADNSLEREDATPASFGRVYSLRRVVHVDLANGCPVNPAWTVSGLTVKIPNTSEWKEIASLDFNVVEGDAEIVASLQHNASVVTSSKRGGIQYAVAVDSAICAESITGSGDRSDDLTGEGYGGTGIIMPIKVGTYVRLVPGPHTASLMARMTRGRKYEAPSTNDYFWVGTVRLFAEAR